MRVAEQISLLDHLSGRSVILGLGRGLARVEYEGFRIDQNAGGSVLLNTLSSSWMASKRLYRGRCHAPAATPGHPALSAQIISGAHLRRGGVAGVDADHGEAGRWSARDPAKTLGHCAAGFAIYHQVYRETNSTEAPPPFCGGFFFVDENADRAEAMAYKHIAPITTRP